MSDFDKQTLDDEMFQFFSRIRDRRASSPQKPIERGTISTTIVEQILPQRLPEPADDVVEEQS